jgi:hypothetical protein
MQRQHRHPDLAGGRAVAGERGHRHRVGRITRHPGVQRGIVGRALVAGADVAERVAAVQAQLHQVAEQPGGPVQVADQRALGDPDRVEDRGQVGLLLLGALRHGLAHAGAGVHALGQLRTRQLCIHGQAPPERVLGFIGLRVVLADPLVDHAQVQAEVIGH